MLDAQASGCGIVLDARSHGGRFAQLLRALHQVSGERVVVLTDEYDKPILDVLGKPEIARANRDFLRGLYGVIKSC
ncbi:MAG: AAA family ATPase, partial [Gammaproteobacteria bacterium]|nr:AAA family ATPase [Gammaproteobacteria bacterium]